MGTARYRCAGFVRAAAMVLLAAPAAGCGGGGTEPLPETLPFEHYDAGFFSIDKPRGWQVLTAGGCTTFAFLLRDPQEPLRQIFYFGTLGPVYLNQEQKDLDAWYVAHGGFPHTWMDAPVVDPLTPENFIAHWPRIAEMNAATAFMPDFPPLADLALVAHASQAAMLPGAFTGNARGLFGRNGRVGEGMFLATVKTFSPWTGNPGGGTAYGNFVCGVSAPKGEFAGVADRLVASLESFTVTRGYVDDCFRQAQQQWGAVAAAGRTLSEASDVLWEGWEARTHSEDISAEKWSDAYRDVERVYDPGTGEVYEVPVGWYTDYDLHRGEYDMSGLQPMPPDDWEAWMRAVLEGSSRIH